MKKYTGEYTREISFPLGGIGTGSVGLAGNGRLMDWEIFNRPDKGSMNVYSHLAVRAIDETGRITAKVLQGDCTENLTGQYGLNRLYQGFGHAVDKKTMAGFPHFPKWSFSSEFPFAELEFSAEDFPAEVKLKAFNPFIPMDEDNSSIPAAFFEVEFRNTSEKTLRFGSAFSIGRSFKGNNREVDLGNGRRGIFMRSELDERALDYRDLTISSPEENAILQPCWYRGRWSDSLSTFWHEFSACEALRNRTYPENFHEDTATVYAEKEIAPGKTERLRFLMTWSAPFCYNYWDPLKDRTGADITWKNYYATIWRNSADSCRYAMENWEMLESRSKAFSDAVYSSTLDPVLLEAATYNLSTLKSPTVLRLEDGTLWGWEGVHEHEGSCEGSCNHVWNYAYALPFLFPRLERSMREADYRYNMQENGKMAFRIRLPLGRPGWHIPCVDGQMGGVIKTYREWKLSGNTEWLARIWPDVKRSLEYAWVDDGQFSWDVDRDGVMEGRQHHTLDMELFGPSGWLQGFYLAALKAAAEMADALGEHEDAEGYREVFRRGSKWTEENLFNGEYYFQKVDLNDSAIVERFGCMKDYWNSEFGEIKYQIGEGSEIDQLCAQWHATICGLGDVFDKTNRRTALQSLHRYNYRSTVRDLANPWRLFILNDEDGTLICYYPEGKRKPLLPVPYCEEVFYGTEYALGALMLAEGMEAEGMKTIRAVRNRFDGKKRNPFNEFECGSNYARSMASWSFLPILSGFTFDMTKQRIGFRPPYAGETFRCFWSCGEAWGTVELSGSHAELRVIEGELTLKCFDVACGENRSVKAVCDGVSVAAEGNGETVCFEAPVSIRESLKLFF